MSSQKPPMKKNPDHGASFASGSPTATRAVDPAALRVLVRVRHLVGGDPERRHAALARTISHVNPLSYEVDALRGPLLYSHAHLGADLAVLVAAAAIGITAASALLPQLAR